MGTRAEVAADSSPTTRVTAGYILGLDPGLRVTGYGVVDRSGQQPRLVEAGVVRINPRQSLERRLDELFSGLGELFDSLPIGEVAVEQLYSHYARPRTAILMGHARGVIYLAAARHGVPVFAYLPNAIKKYMTGNGHAGKLQMQLAVQHQLQLAAPPEPHDVADALAIALCHRLQSQP